MEVYDQIRSETDDQSDDILAYADVNENNYYDVYDHFIIPPWGELDEDQQALALDFEAMFAALSAAFLDRTEYDEEPDVDTPFDIKNLNALLKAIGLPPLLPSATIDLASWWEDVDPTGFRDGLRSLVNILALVLPPPPPY
ncbi:MAG: hypothetical protein M5R36_02140 [Deltaproteobacteria bacterium]|nr:hypothetical protein [Deltaproteobacteria bacterium]